MDINTRITLMFQYATNVFCLSSDIDECATLPCQNGDCVDLVNEFSCTCTGGFTGTLCETGMAWVAQLWDGHRNDIETLQPALDRCQINNKPSRCAIQGDCGWKLFSAPTALWVNSTLFNRWLVFEELSLLLGMVSIYICGANKNNVIINMTMK